MTATLAFPSLAPPLALRRRSNEHLRAIAVAMLILFAFAGRLCYLAKPFDHDARLFIYLGKLFTDGGRFGHDVIDNKFPTVGMMTSVAWRLLGLSWPPYVLTQAAMVALGSWILARSARRHFDPSAAMPTALFALVFLNFSVAVFGGFQLETMQALFAIFAASASLEALRSGEGWDGFLVGLAGGCAMMFKPTGGAVLGAFALACVIKFSRNPRGLLKQACAAACGLALPAIVTLLYLIRSDTLRDMPALYQQIARYAADTPMTLIDWCKPLLVLALLGFPLFVRTHIFRHDRVNDITGPNRAMMVFVFAWFTLELAGVILQRRMCAYHFLVVAPPAALIYGMIPRRPRLAPIVAALAPVLLLSTISAARGVQQFYPAPARLPASDYLIAHTTPADSIWSDSFGRLLLETSRKPGARVPISYLFWNSNDAPQQYAAILLSDFEHRRPKYILLPKDFGAWLAEQDRSVASLPGYEIRRINYDRAWQSILDYVHARYVPETNIAGDTLYRRRDSLPATANLR